MSTSTPEKLSSIYCINCGTESSTDYCPNCGQPFVVKRISVASLWSDFRERVIGLDGRFTRTFIMTFRNPGQMSREYIDGLRLKYMPPVGYFFITLSAMVLLMQMQDVSITDFSAAQIDQMQAGEGAERQKLLMGTLAPILNDYFRQMNFLSVFISGVLIWLFSRRNGLNLSEHMVFAFYVEAGIDMFSILSTPFIAHGYTSLGMILSISSTLYFIYAYVTFSKNGSLALRIFKGLCIRLLVFTIVGIFSALAMAVWLFTHKEMVESILKPLE